MTTKISTSFVKRLATKPPAKVKDYRDAHLTGFMVRHQPSGNISYYVQFGRARRRKIGRHPTLTVTEAREAARKILAAAALKQLPGIQKPQRVRVGEFARGTYADWARGHLKCHDVQLERLDTYWGHLFGRYLDEIAKTDIERWRLKEKAKGSSPATINRHVNVIRSVLARATEWDLLAHNPLAGFGVLRVDHGRPPRMLHENERQRFLAAARARGDHLRSLVLFLYFTGCRRGEAFNLTWADVDFERRRIVVQGGGTKSGKTRTIPMNDELISALRKWKMRSGGRAGYVWQGRHGGRLNTIKTGWQTICREAAIADFKLKDLRSDACSRLVNNGTPIAVAQRLLGHASPVTTAKHYVKIEETTLREAVAAL